MSYEGVPRWIREIPKHLKTSEIYKEAVTQFSYALEYVPDCLKTQEMCNDAISKYFFLFLILLK